MLREVESLVAGYERGVLSRRDLVGALVAIATTGAVTAPAAAAARAELYFADADGVTVQLSEPEYRG